MEEEECVINCCVKPLLRHLAHYNALINRTFPSVGNLFCLIRKERRNFRRQQRIALELLRLTQRRNTLIYTFINFIILKRVYGNIKIFSEVYMQMCLNGCLVADCAS